jgi:hypothetical protein
MNKHAAFAEDLDTVLSNLRQLLIDKNLKYGDSVLSPVRVFSKSSIKEQIFVRLDDKLSRLMSNQANEDEDVFLDLLGYLIINEISNLRIKREE